MKIRWTWWFYVGLLSGLLAAACGGEEATPTARPPESTAAPRATATTAPAPTAAAPTAAPAPTATPRPAPTQAPAPTPTTGARAPQGKLTIVMSSFGNEEVDPRHLTAFSSIVSPMYDAPLWRESDGRLSPGVATKWESAADGLSVTLTLRDGMTFHNGDRLTAEDLKFSIERVLLPDSRAGDAGQWKSFLSSIEVRLPNRVVLHWKQPWHTSAGSLAPPDSMVTTVLPKAGLERLGEREFFNNSQYGSGPWRFVDHKTGVSFTYEAWDKKHPFRPTPDFKTAQFLLIGEESTRVAMLRTGAANLASVSPDAARGLRPAGFSFHQVIVGTQTRLLFWGLNNPQVLQTKPVAKKEVRQALSLAINRQEIIDTLLGGLSKIPPRDVVNPGMEGFDPNWKPFPYDPAQAKQLLTQAGYPSGGFTVDLYNPALVTSPWTPRAGEAIASYWEAIGVKTRVIAMEYGAYRPLFRQYPHQTLAGAWGWLPSGIGDTARFMFSAWHSKGTVHRLDDPQIDALLDRAPTLADPAERVRVYHEIMDRVYQLWIAIPMAFDVEVFAGGPDIAGWDPLFLPANFSVERIKRKGA